MTLKVIALRSRELTAKAAIETLHVKDLRKSIVTFYSPSIEVSTRELKLTEICTFEVKRSTDPKVIAEKIKEAGGDKYRFWMSGEYQRVLQNFGLAGYNGVPDYDNIWRLELNP